MLHHFSEGQLQAAPRHLLDAEGWRKISNTSSKDEVSGPQQKGCSAVDVSGGKSKGHAVKDSIASQVALVVKKPPANAGGIRDSG